MTTELSDLAASYVDAVNRHAPDAFLRLFAENAVVDDNGKKYVGQTAIKEWSQREIFDANVTLEVRDAVVSDRETVVTTKVDGNFDRTGLPDPVIIDHHITREGPHIGSLTCRLAS